jgi:hypothetical protein
MPSVCNTVTVLLFRNFLLVILFSLHVSYTYTKKVKQQKIISKIVWKKNPNSRGKPSSVIFTIFDRKYNFKKTVNNIKKDNHPQTDKKLKL